MCNPAMKITKTKKKTVANMGYNYHAEMGCVSKSKIKTIYNFSTPAAKRNFHFRASGNAPLNIYVCTHSIFFAFFFCVRMFDDLSKNCHLSLICVFHSFLEEPADMPCQYYANNRQSTPSGDNLRNQERNVL